MQYFRGHPYIPPPSGQEGHGLGSILSSIARTAIPFLKPIARSIGRTVLDKGCEVGRDVIEGQNLKSSFKQRVFGQDPPQEGSGRRRRKRKRQAVKAKKRKPVKRKKRKSVKRKRKSVKRKKPNQDIFS